MKTLTRFASTVLATVGLLLGVVCAPAATAGPVEAQRQAVVSRATSQIGVPYAWGGGNASGPTQGVRDGGISDSHGDYAKVGFDCGGLMQYAFAAAGLQLPHYTGSQYFHGKRISLGELAPGDVIFYGVGGRDHVALYIGGNQVVEAPASGESVRISPLSTTNSPQAKRLL